MPGRRAPIRFVWARGGGERSMAAGVRHHWQGHSVYAGMMLRMGQLDFLVEISLRLPAWPGRAVVRGIEPPDGVSLLSGFQRSLPVVG
jgi:hypothetical protein